MKITSPCVVTLTWALTDTLNEPIDALETPTEFLVGGDDLLASVEREIAGQSAGFETRVQIEPADAFGDYHADLVCFEERKLFPEPLEVGMAFEGLPPGARTPTMPTDVAYVVTDLFPQHVVLDGNHPLAGFALRLALKVLAVRAPTEEELEAGSLGMSAVSVLRTTKTKGFRPQPEPKH